MLVRDALAYRGNGDSVLLAGVRPEWLEKPMSVHNLPAHLGPCSFEYRPEKGIEWTSAAKPPRGIALAA